MTNRRIESALISVFYKDGIDELAKYLHDSGVTIFSTGGTQKHLESLGIKVIPVESVTSYPSILGGRVKTLHPGIFGGILNRADNESDQAELKEHHIQNIDLVWVDLYPFSETVAKTNDESEIIEKIDIGGVSLIRAAAKNFNDKVIISDKHQINGVYAELKKNNLSTNVEFRKRLAGEAFLTTKKYDTEISHYFTNVSTVLRYGENPHQQARFDGNLNEVFTQLNGKEISYNNLLDIDAALSLINDVRPDDQHVFAILKHNNACGFAIRDSIKEAYESALAADPVSAFGGILATHSNIDLATAELMNDLFFEVLLAPSFDQDALQLLSSKKNRIILQTGDYFFPSENVRSALNGVLVQDRDSAVNAITDFNIVSKIPPTASQLQDLFFANVLVKHTKSNAIILAKNNQLLASGTGQTSRVDALQQAIAKARHFGFDLNGAVMASDAFFPFPDCVEIADKAGVTAVIHPGGSIKDQLSVDYCNDHGMAMVMTGMRHFKH
ncbi:MAG: bifunctional phosphoribosylaminoimidazolecarboxamide formyltransferase/IMP cyclohydrolase [Bacteroidetes bacterium]|nr:bifunctional phosphoribosylaminoimidazolecarboxamide formyltransferase/IMP cyclohydrolase [Bacteroidota bacterium]